MFTSSITACPTWPDDSSKLIYHTRERSTLISPQDFVADAISDIAKLIEHYYTSSPSREPIHTLYVNATMPQQLNVTIANLAKSSDPPTWLQDDGMMKNFRYERISDLPDLQRVVESTQVDVLVVENLSPVVRNSINGTHTYTKANAQLVYLIKLMKMKARLKVVIIDVEASWFVQLLV